MSQEQKHVIFQNGRVMGRNRPGHQVRSYRNSNGIIVDFQNIPLYKEDGELDMVPVGPNKDLKPRTWDQIVDFTKSKTIRLHPVIHKDVIAAIRDMRSTVTSHKPNGPISGSIIEYEPWVRMDQEYQSSISLATAMARLNTIVRMENKLTLWLSATMMDVSARNEKEIVSKLTASASADPDRFNDLFTGDKPEEVELKDDMIPQSIVDLARALKVINLKNGIWYFDKERLGSNYNRISIDYLDSVPAIQEAVEKAL